MSNPEIILIVPPTIPPTKRKDGVLIGSSRERTVKITPILRPLVFLSRVWITATPSLCPHFGKKEVPKMMELTYPILPDAYAFYVESGKAEGQQVEIGAFRRVQDGRYFYLPFPNLCPPNSVMCRGSGAMTPQKTDAPEEIISLLELGISTYHYQPNVASLCEATIEQVHNFTLEGIWSPIGHPLEHFITRGTLPPDYVREIMECAE